MYSCQSGITEDSKHKLTGFNNDDLMNEDDENDMNSTGFLPEILTKKYKVRMPKIGKIDVEKLKNKIMKEQDKQIEIK